jgi:hypothetical protein
MTEREWLACADPTPMLEFLGGRASDRKLRLFAVACCRRIWSRLPSPSSRRAVEAVESHADGHPADLAGAAAERGHWEAIGDWEGWQPAPNEARVIATRAAQLAVLGLPDEDVARRAGLTTYPAQVAAAAADAVRLRATFREGANANAARVAERAAQARLVRCLFGNPFRRPVALDPAWVAGNGGTVPRLAGGAYTDRAFKRLPILADALEDAGCADADLLGHLRGPGPHVRGCWALDALLAKE